MNWFKRIVDRRHRRARAAEGAGRWRDAAELWAEAGEMARAADSLLHLADRLGSVDERLDVWHDALRFIPAADEEKRADVEARMGRAVLEDLRERGAASAEERRRLTEAAARLERGGAPAEAADAYAMLGREEDQARCLQAAGKIEALEALLERSAEDDARAGRLRRLLSTYEMALAYGARLEALEALVEAAELAPEDRSITELLRQLHDRRPAPGGVTLVVAGRRLRCIGKLPAVLGRAEADIALRGSSISRRHAELAREGDRLVVRDLGSRNGTLVHGVPIGGSVELGGGAEIGLGDDIRVAVRPTGPSALELEVTSGLDRGQKILVGEGALALIDAPASLRFEDDWAVLVADRGVEMKLGERGCTLPVPLLIGDELTLDGVRVEVVE